MTALCPHLQNYRSKPTLKGPEESTKGEIKAVNLIRSSMGKFKVNGLTAEWFKPKFPTSVLNRY